MAIIFSSEQFLSHLSRTRDRAHRLVDVDASRVRESRQVRMSTLQRPWAATDSLSLHVSSFHECHTRQNSHHEKVRHIRVLRFGSTRTQ
jgi:hypothetical protein